METYEVFRRTGHRDPFEHAGAVIAPDPDMALLMAKECFFRRREGEHLWVVARSDVHSLGDESLLAIAADKSYRFASDYRDVMEKRQAALERARGIAANE